MPSPGSTEGRGAPALVALSGAVLTACVAAWAARGDWTGDVAGFLALFGAASLAYLAALVGARGLGRRGLAAALVLAAAWRAALVAAPPLLSDDVHRSVWEGRIQRHGGNPYAWEQRPESPRWAALRDEVWQSVNHKDYTAIYPPLWQLAMRAVTSVHDSVTAVKAFVAGCDLLALWPLAVWLRRRGLPRERLLILAWSPLALVEGAGSGHGEALGVLLLAGALALLEAGRPLGAALALGAGAQVKLLPALVALGWLRRLGGWRLLLALAAAALLAIPYLGAGAGLWMSLQRYSEHWRFNETLAAALAAAAGSHGAAVELGLATLVLATLVLAALALGASRVEPVTAGLAVVALTLALSPNVLPWYALWLLPLLVARPYPPLLLYTITAALAYLVYPAWQSGERWQLSWGWRALEYLPCLALAVVDLWRRRLRPAGEPAAARVGPLEART